jgi:hypothetical protein
LSGGRVKANAYFAVLFTDILYSSAHISTGSLMEVNSSNDIPEHDTHLGVKIIFPEVCQNTVGNSEKGTNACSGISIQLAEYFRTNKLQINRESAMEVFPKVIREMVSKFDWENLELMDVNTALS